MSDLKPEKSKNYYHFVLNVRVIYDADGKEMKSLLKIAQRNENKHTSKSMSAPPVLYAFKKTRFRRTENGRHLRPNKYDEPCNEILILWSYCHGDYNNKKTYNSDTFHWLYYKNAPSFWSKTTKKMFVKPKTFRKFAIKRARKNCPFHISPRPNKPVNSIKPSLLSKWDTDHF